MADEINLGYSAERKRRRLPWLAIIVFATVIALLASPIVWIYSGWYQEQAEITRERQSVGWTCVSRTTRIGPAWAQTVLGSHAYWLDRASDIDFMKGEALACLPMAPAFAWAHHIEIYGSVSHPTDAEAASISQLKNLTYLGLAYAPITDRTLLSVRVPENLQVVSLDYLPNITDAGMRFLAHSSRLAGLDLNVLSISDNGIANADLSSKADLTGVLLAETPVADRGVRLIAGAPHLAALAIIHCPITDGSVTAIGMATNLTSLVIENCRISGRTFAALAHLNKLELLSLKDSDIDDRGFASLPPLPSLKMLRIDGTRITDRGLDHLKAFPALRDVVIPRQRSSDDFKALQLRFPSLKIESPR